MCRPEKILKRSLPPVALIAALAVLASPVAYAEDTPDGETPVKKGAATHQPNPEGVARLREAILTREILTLDPNLTRQLLTDAVTESDDVVLCVVMDWNVGLIVATVVSWADGSTSLYLNSGTAFLGVNSYESVASAARRFRDIATTLRDRMTPVDSFPLPTRSDTVVFYLVTKAKTVASKEIDVGLFALPPDHPLAALYESAQALLAEIRREVGWSPI
jgi:hypothetical protein